MFIAGINGAGKTTQLQIITGALQPDSGAVVKEKPNMRIAYLTQEFDVEPTRTVRVCPLGPLLQDLRKFVTGLVHQSTLRQELHLWFECNVYCAMVYFEECPWH